VEAGEWDVYGIFQPHKGELRDAIPQYMTSNIENNPALKCQPCLTNSNKINRDYSLVNGGWIKIKPIEAIQLFLTRISKPAPSATRPSLQPFDFKGYKCISKLKTRLQFEKLQQACA
jgi:hypothetical protein